MRLAIALLLAACSTHATWAAADLCEEPAKTVCGAGPPAAAVTSDDIRKDVYVALSGGKGMDLEDPTKMLDNYKTVIAAVYKAMLARLASSKITEKQIFEKIQEIRKKLAGDFRVDRLGQDSDPLMPTNFQLAKKLESTELVLPSHIAEASATTSEIQNYFLMCGPDGLVPNAYYYEGKFLICPGALLSVLNSGSLDLLYVIVGHELTHSANQRAGDFFKSAATRYPGMLACLRDNYSASFKDATSFVNQLSGPTHDKLAAAAQKVYDKADKTQTDLLILQQLAVMDTQLQGQVAAIRGQVAEMREGLGHDPDPAESHLYELVADTGAQDIALSALRGASADKRVALAQSLYGFLCHKPSEDEKQIEKALGITVDEEGIHPTGDFRINQFFYRPEVRLALGCKELAPPSPWCGPVDRAPVVARCDAKHGGKSGSGCEARLIQELSSIGCRKKDVRCGPSDGSETDCIFSLLNCRMARRAGAGKARCAGEGKTEDLKDPGPPLPAVCVRRPAPSDYSDAPWVGKAGSAK